MTVPTDLASITPQFQEISSNSCRSLQRKLTDGTITSTLVKRSIGDKYFVVITQKKSTTDNEPVGGGGGNIIEVQKRVSLLSGCVIDSKQHYEVNPVFGACPHEHLAACRFISQGALRYTNKSLLIGFGLTDIAKSRLQAIASDLEEIIKQFEENAISSQQ